MSKRVVFLGSKPIGYHCFQFLLENQERLDIHLQGVLTKDAVGFDATWSVRQLAEENSIPLLKALDELPETDFLVSVQYHEILKPVHLLQAKQLAINLHMAPLPEYRGCNQFSLALLEKKEEFGTTLHVMDAGIDHGDLLAEERFPIPSNCWVEDLYQLTFDASLRLFQREIPLVLEGVINRTTQSSLESVRGTSLHFRHEIQELKQINLDQPKVDIERQIRATIMPGFEPPFIVLDNKKIYLSSTWQHE
jgi:methionyl-tRNA formyltransferase